MNTYQYYSGCSYSYSKIYLQNPILILKAPTLRVQKGDLRLEGFARELCFRAVGLSDQRSRGVKGFWCSLLSKPETALSPKTPTLNPKGYTPQRFGDYCFNLTLFHNAAQRIFQALLGYHFTFL